jgi:hypothetical protein
VSDRYVTSGLGVGEAVQVGRGVGSSLFGVILFLCLMDRLCSDVGGVLAGIFALVFVSFVWANFM